MTTSAEAPRLRSIRLDELRRLGAGPAIRAPGPFVALSPEAFRVVVQSVFGAVAPFGPWNIPPQPGQGPFDLYGTLKTGDMWIFEVKSGKRLDRKELLNRLRANLEREPIPPPFALCVVVSLALSDQERAELHQPALGLNLVITDAVELVSMIRTLPVEVWETILQGVAATAAQRAELVTLHTDLGEGAPRSEDPGEPGRPVTADIAVALSQDFNVTELYRWLHSQTWTAATAASMPTPEHEAPQIWFHRATEALVQRGLLTAESPLMDALIQARPARRAEIERLFAAASPRAWETAFQDLFGVEEFIVFLAASASDGAEITRSLEPARRFSLLDYVDHVVRWLQRQRLLGDPFFDAWVAERPNKRDRIEVLRGVARLGGARPPVQATNALPPSLDTGDAIAAAPPVERLSDGTAAYSSDAVDPRSATDHLGRRAEAEVLARIIVSRQVDPPLSIALLGAWGSGKSTYMGLLHQEIERLAETARAAGTSDTSTCQRVAHVWFNAWHYSDSNLWASLVGHLFETLASELSPEDATGPARRALLENVILEKEGALAGERARVATAEAYLEELRRRTSAGRAQVALDKLLREQDVVALRGRAEAIGWGRSLRDALDVRDVVDAVDTRRLRFLVRGIWEAVVSPTGAWLGRWVARIASAVCLVSIAIFFGAPTFPTVLALLQRLGVASGTLSSLLLVWVGWTRVTSFLDAGREAVGKADERLKELAALGRDDAARPRRDSLPEALRKRDVVEMEDLDHLDTWLARQKARVAAQQEELAKLESRRTSSDPTKGLRDWIQERSASTDYRERQGLITMVRRDLEALSRAMGRYRAFLRDGLSHRAALRNLEEGAPSKGRAGADGPVEKVATRVDDRGDVVAGDETRRTFELDPVERIVLYVDDLDRCSPAQVVEVLQALHLLLSLDLFVIVVAVDPHWLLGSLRVVYGELFSGQNENDGLAIPAATPVAYLEKIFQIPIALGPMEGAAFGALMGELARAGDTPPSVPASAATVADPSPAEDPPDTPPVDAPSPAAATTPPRGPPPLPAPTPPPPLVEPAPDAARAMATVEAGITRTIVHLAADEVRFLQALHAFVPSPRSAKRVVNAYRLARAVVAWRQGGLVPWRQREAMMLLLAVLAGYPECWASLIRALEDLGRTGGAGALILSALPASYPRPRVSGGTEQQHKVRDAEWSRLLEALHALPQRSPAVGLIATVGDLLDGHHVVARYSIGAATAGSVAIHQPRTFRISRTTTRPH